MLPLPGAAGRCRRLGTLWGGDSERAAGTRLAVLPFDFLESSLLAMFMNKSYFKHIENYFKMHTFYKNW